MKKFLVYLACTFFLSLFVACNAPRGGDRYLDSSQQGDDKLSFQGIVIDGSIKEFGEKLLKKGYRLCEENIGNNVYEGYFDADDAKIVVFFDNSSQKVYSCRIVIERDDLKWAKVRFLYYKNLYISGYNGFALHSDMDPDLSNDPEEFSLCVIKPPVEEGSKVLGMILLSVKETYKGHSIFIDYKNTEELESELENTN